MGDSVYKFMNLKYINYVIPYELIELIMNLYINLYIKYVCVLLMSENCIFCPDVIKIFGKLQKKDIKLPIVQFKYVSISTIDANWVIWVPMILLLPDYLYDNVLKITNDNKNMIKVMNGVWDINGVLNHVPEYKMDMDGILCWIDNYIKLLYN